MGSMPLPDRPGFSGSKRFEIVRVLGTGGMGVVYEAFDRERETRVALKTLLSLEGEARLRLKAEFRSLRDLIHPNLVSIGELFEEGEHLFFTMELVRGVDFLAYVRPFPTRGQGAPAARPPTDEREGKTLGGGHAERLGRASRHPVGPAFDETRLRAAFGQLAQGLTALHAAQKVHRDIKPSNVLVTDEGRVIILDFGVVADLSDRLDTADGQRVVGTADYMAPEQSAAKPIGPEADWYSAGVMLYRALTGVFPFEMAPEAVIAFKQRVEPARPSVLAEGLPPDLEGLCVNLLRIDPSLRPTGTKVLERLGILVGDDPPAPLARLVPSFVGRRAELAFLHEAFVDSHRGPIAVLIDGESGVGKSLARYAASSSRSATAPWRLPDVVTSGRVSRSRRSTN